MKKTRTLLLAISLGLGLGMNAYAATTPEFGGNDVVAFSSDGGDTWTYYTAQEQSDPYVFTANGNTAGLLVFNPNMKNIEVVNDFQLKGKNFRIQTAAEQTVSFSQPLSNQGTAVTLTGSGTVETHGSAAFANITVNNGATMKVYSQIGVTERFNVKAGGHLELGSTAQLLLTDQINNEGFLTLNPGAKVDASNLSAGASERLGIQFEGLDGQPNPDSGFLYGGEGVETTIASGKGYVNVIDPKDVGSDLKVAQLQVGSLSFDIGENGVVQRTETEYSVWFQNGGISPGIQEITYYAQLQGASGTTFMATRGDGAGTTLTVNTLVYSGDPLYITLGTEGRIEVTDPYAAVGTLKVFEKAHVTVTGWSGNINHLNDVSFIGQGITLKTEESKLGSEFDPLNLTVENASSVTILSTVRPAYGYFNGEEYSNVWWNEDHPTDLTQTEYKAGEYLLRGTLTIGDGGALDLRQAHDSEYASVNERNKDTKAVTDVTYQEEFAHLTMTEQGKLTIQKGGVLLVSSVTDNSGIVNGNLDTARKIASAKYEEYEDSWGDMAYRIVDKDGIEIDPDSLNNYTVNGTVEIRDIVDWRNVATITANGGEAAQFYTTRNSNFTVANADINIVDEFVSGYIDTVDEQGMPKTITETDAGNTATTISNVLIGDSVTNSKASGTTVTLDNEESNNYKKLWAKDGDIAITNNTSVNAETVQIGANREVSVSSKTPIAPEELLRDGSLTVTNLLRADGSGDNLSKIGADLNLSVGVTLDVAAANGKGGVDMQSNKVAFGGEYGAQPLTLSWRDHDQVWAMEKGGTYDLFSNVSEFSYYYYDNEPTYIASSWEYDFSYPDSIAGIDASLYFKDLEEGAFALCYSGDSGSMYGKNVGTVYLMKITDKTPEPTTGTLSLLALAALAARRRRK